MVELRGITKRFGDEKVLEDVSFRVSAAHSHVIFGGSGSGKSTLLKIAAGMVSPDSGAILIGDRDVSGFGDRDWAEMRKTMGIVFQEGALFDSLSVGGNVGYRLRDEGGWSEAEMDAMVMKVLGFVGLEHTVDLMPSELSGGMRRRVAIARAIIGNPRIMLYDEPTAGLDPITARTICDLIVRLRDMEGVTSIVVSHDLNAAFFIAQAGAVVDSEGNSTMREEGSDFCYVHTSFSVLKDRRIIFTGNQDQLMVSPDPYIQEFVS